MHLSKVDIEKRLRQGKEFIFIGDAEINRRELSICAMANVPAEWNSPHVPSVLIAEAMGQTAEILIRELYSVQGILYLIKMNDFRIFKNSMRVEVFQKTEIVLSGVYKVNHIYYSGMKAFFEETCISRVEMQHYAV